MRNKVKFLQSISMIIAALIAVSLSSCGKKSVNTAAVTAITGKAEIIRNGENPKQLKVKDVLEMNDVVITGADSVVSIQIDKYSTVNIVEKTNFKISSLTANKEFFLENGKVFTKITKLEKGMSYIVYTKNTTVAVRGTDFSVSAEGKQTVVAVNDGKILVRGNAESCKGTEKIIEKGNTAVLIDKIEVRPLSANEKKDFQKNEELSQQIIASGSEKK